MCQPLSGRTESSNGSELGYPRGGPPQQDSGSPTRSAALSRCWFTPGPLTLLDDRDVESHGAEQLGDESILVEFGSSLKVAKCRGTESAQPTHDRALLNGSAELSNAHGLSPEVVADREPEFCSAPFEWSSQWRGNQVFGSQREVPARLALEAQCPAARQII